ncbi:hypothetical protein [Actinoplanes subglobosus]|uniref:Uncharacterized protein n=1 Tax=Actinoplanes subglobosus TaxID=1547892 RepID=A0ABV8IK43_9ACTN
MKRALVVSTGAAMMVAAAALPAQAATYTTTGAWGEVVHYSGSNPGEMVYNMYAKDPAEDGHCARWQFRLGTAAWQWHGAQVCTGTRTYTGKAYGKYNHFYRLCRTGSGGSCTKTLEFA